VSSPQLKFIDKRPGGKATGPFIPLGAGPETRPAWVAGIIKTGTGAAYRVSSDITGKDLWEHFKCRVSGFRDNYRISPGLYAVGNPDSNSEVLVSANYKLSFDHLRRELRGLDVWIIVLDTRGINVWCAAGKGTFGTDELAMQIIAIKLDKVVEHRRVIVPQLGAVGVSAHKVRKATGFRVHYGPVYARDLRAFIGAGYKASQAMRAVSFPLRERLILTPMEINPAMKKYYPWYALLMLGIFGLQPAGIIFGDAWSGGLPFLILGLISIFAGAFLTPLLLPLVPFRSFAVKGWIIGMASVILSTRFSFFSQQSIPLLFFTYLFFPLASSYVALQFTGSTTFTGMSGVKKELRVSIPVYILGIAISAALLVVYKIGQWRTL
jgi:hypothetical protein